MLKPGAYFICVDPDPQRSKGEVRTFEADTAGCAHCGRHTFVKPFQNPADAGGWCYKCARTLCTRCAGFDRCQPQEENLRLLEEKINLSLEQQQTLRDYGFLP